MVLAASQPGTTFSQTDTAQVVGSVAELVAALRPGSAARHIRLLPGEYVIDRALSVPDGTTLEGAGSMQLEDGLPAGFAPGTASTLRVVPGLQGDLLTLGDGVALSKLRIVDQPSLEKGAPPRAGNTVALVSRQPGDRVAATVTSCVLLSGNRPGVGAEGPIGHAIAVFTQNPGRAEAPAPHSNARLQLRVEGSVIRTSGGGKALFAINFAARGNVEVRFQSNLLDGGLVAAGGVSRPDPVFGASIVIESLGNLWRAPATGSREPGWVLIGGSSAHLPGLAAPGALGNSVRVSSREDRIVGFRVGIQAAGGRRWRSASGPVSDNRVALDLIATWFEQAAGGGSELVLDGALAALEADGVREFEVGDRNRVEVHMSGARGAAAVGANHYADASGPTDRVHLGEGNRLEFAGSRTQFALQNPGFADLPGAAFFAARE